MDSGHTTVTIDQQSVSSDGLEENSSPATSPETKTKQPSPREVTWTEIQAIQHSAESSCAGVTQRVTVADFTAIVTAVVATLGGHFPFRPRLSPPPALLVDVANALGIVASANLPKTTRASPVPLGTAAKSAVRKSEGSRAKKVPPTKPKTSKTPGLPQKGSSPRDRPQSANLQTSSAPKVERSEDERRMDKFLSKMLRSYRSGSNAAKYVREQLRLSKQQIVDHVKNLSPENILEAKERQRAGIPAIAATGLLVSAAPYIAGGFSDREGIDVSPPISWSTVTELDEWINSAVRRYRVEQGEPVNGPLGIAQINVPKGSTFPMGLEEARSFTRTAVESLREGLTPRLQEALGTSVSELDTLLHSREWFLSNYKGTNMVMLSVRLNADASGPEKRIQKSYISLEAATDDGRPKFHWSADRSLVKDLCTSEFLLLKRGGPVGDTPVDTFVAPPASIPARPTQGRTAPPLFRGTSSRGGTSKKPADAHASRGRGRGKR